MKAWVITDGKKYYDGLFCGPLNDALLFSTKKAAEEMSGELLLYNDNINPEVRKVEVKLV